MSGLKEQRKTIITAFFLFLVDAFYLNQGALSVLVVVTVIFVSIPKSLWIRIRRKDKALFKKRVKESGIYLIMAMAVFSSNYVNNRIAHHRAEKLIVACDQFFEKNQRYPLNLEELVPEFIPEIPTAKYALMGEGFHYSNRDGRAFLAYVKFPPFGRKYFSFDTRTWEITD